MVPHLPTLVLAFILAGLHLAQAFGVKITDTQDTLILGFVATGLAVLAAFLPSKTSIKVLPPAALLMLSACAAGQQIANTAVEATCVAVADVEQPALAPLCVDLVEVAQAIEALVEEDLATANAKLPKSTVPYSTRLYNKIVWLRAQPKVKK